MVIVCVLFQAFCNEVQNLQKMNTSLKVLVGQQHAERAHVPPHDFPPGAMMVCEL